MQTGGALFIPTAEEKIMAHGYNPDFDYINTIDSHRSIIYGVLSAILFIDTCENYYAITITIINFIQSYGDNLEAISKCKSYKNTQTYLTHY